MRRLLVLLAVPLAIALAPVATGSDAKVVKVGDDFFKPVKVTVGKGQTVKWTWGNGTKHKHTVTEANGRFSSKKKKTGTYKHTFKKAGTFTIYCATHPSKMVMKVVVKK